MRFLRKFSSLGKDDCYYNITRCIKFHFWHSCRLEFLVFSGRSFEKRFTKFAYFLHERESTGESRGVNSNIF